MLCSGVDKARDEGETLLLKKGRAVVTELQGCVNETMKPSSGLALVEESRPEAVPLPAPGPKGASRALGPNVALFLHFFVFKYISFNIYLFTLL